MVPRVTRDLSGQDGPRMVRGRKDRHGWCMDDGRDGRSGYRFAKR